MKTYETKTKVEAFQITRISDNGIGGAFLHGGDCIRNVAPSWLNATANPAVGDYFVSPMTFVTHIVEKEEFELNYNIAAENESKENGIMQHTFRKDDDGNPAGGTSVGTGFGINWQDGPINDDNPRNGAFVEEIIETAIRRIQFYQESRFRCTANEIALIKLREALDKLNARTAERTKRGVEGTHDI